MKCVSCILIDCIWNKDFMCTKDQIQIRWSMDQDAGYCSDYKVSEDNLVLPPRARVHSPHEDTMHDPCLSRICQLEHSTDESVKEIQRCAGLLEKRVEELERKLRFGPKY